MGLTIRQASARTGSTPFPGPNRHTATAYDGRTAPRMESRALQVVSSFTSVPLAETLRPAVVEAGVADELSFAQYGRMAELMLGSGASAAGAVGTVVLLRLEDWLREDAKTWTAESAAESIAGLRPKIVERVAEFVGQLQTLASRGRPAWFVACPSTGWVAHKFKLEALCQTFTDLLVVRLKRLPHVETIAWPLKGLPAEIEDRSADRLGQIPYTPEMFAYLGEMIGRHVVRTISKARAVSEVASSATTADLAAYLKGLNVRVRMAPAKEQDRIHIDRLLRTAAAFALTGENPELSDAEVDSLMQPGRCVLISVADRMSDHGPSGLVGLRTVGDELVVDAMALSCPVLGKQAEFAVLSGLGRIAQERGTSRIAFEYRPSGRNEAMLTYLRAVSEAESATRFVLPVEAVESRASGAATAAGAWTLQL